MTNSYASQSWLFLWRAVAETLLANVAFVAFYTRMAVHVVPEFIMVFEHLPTLLACMTFQFFAILPFDMPWQVSFACKCCWTLRAHKISFLIVGSRVSHVISLAKEHQSALSACVLSNLSVSSFMLTEGGRAGQRFATGSTKIWHTERDIKLNITYLHTHVCGRYLINMPQ